MDKGLSKSSNLKSLLILVSMLTLMILFLTYLYLQNKELEKLANYTPPVITAKNTLQPTPTQLPLSQAIVSITSQGLVPSTLKVSSNTQITFVNKDRRNHQIASDPHPTHLSYPLLNDDEALSPNSSLIILFSKPGTYSFHLEDNPLKFKGTIIVE